MSSREYTEIETGVELRPPVSELRRHAERARVRGDRRHDAVNRREGRRNALLVSGLALGASALATVALWQTTDRTANVACEYPSEEAPHDRSIMFTRGATVLEDVLRENVPAVRLGEVSIGAVAIDIEQHNGVNFSEIKFGNGAKVTIPIDCK